MTTHRLFCFGLGYSARRLALDLMSRGWEVAATVRQKEKVNELKKLGINAFIFNRDQPISKLKPILRQCTHLLSSVPPDFHGDAVIELHGELIASMVNNFSWIGYLSTTGVYGNRNGRMVKERDKLAPTSPRAHRRVQAEKLWMKMNAHIFRIAGIYGPGRSVLESALKGEARRIYKPGHAFSRIHVDDLGLVISASMENPNAGAIYNVCDDEPAEPLQVVGFACKLLGIDLPPIQSFSEAQNNMSSMALTFWNDNKLVDNDRIKKELGVSLIYPSYRQGLKACLEYLD